MTKMDKRTNEQQLIDFFMNSIIYLTSTVTVLVTLAVIGAYIHYR